MARQMRGSAREQGEWEWEKEFTPKRSGICAAEGRVGHVSGGESQLAVARPLPWQVGQAAGA